MAHNWNNQGYGYGNQGNQGGGQGRSGNDNSYSGYGNDAPGGNYGAGYGGAGNYGTGYGGYGGYGWSSWGLGAGTWGQGTGNYGQNLSDQDIQSNLNNALDANPTTSNANINAKVQNKVVTLTGTVRSGNTKRMAGDIAWNQPGVNDVHNNVQVQSRNWLEEAGHAVKEAVT